MRRKANTLQQPEKQVVNGRSKALTDAHLDYGEYGATAVHHGLHHTEQAERKITYPRLLICALSRVNKLDNTNSNLLLRNLLAQWPRERLAQIYSGGDNGDEGFCGNYYHISAQDRIWGRLFFRLKGIYSDDSLFGSALNGDASVENDHKPETRLRGIAAKLLVDSGLYELIFRIHPSDKLLNWTKKIAPDVILVQGYNLSFVWLTHILEQHLHKPIAYYASDDWPSYLYASKVGLLAFTEPVMRRIVARSVTRLFKETDLQFSFNSVMGEEYERRYGKPFTPIMHCDDPERFRLAEPIRLYPPEIRSIIATGVFDDSRWPLLVDLAEACGRLNQEGISARVTVLATRMSKPGFNKVSSCRYVDLREDPGHDLLPSYLKGADLLYLPETFDEKHVRAYRYSISSKAHLFMFSQRPILVYGHPQTGLVTYARSKRWARVVDIRNSDLLFAALRQLLSDDAVREDLVSRAKEVALENHDCTSVRELFRSQILGVTVRRA